MKNRLELRNYIAEHENKDTLIFTFALSQFAATARYPNNYLADNRWTDAVVLTDEGEFIARQVKARAGDFTEADLRMTLLGHFYWQNLLIDIQKSDLNLIREILHHEIIDQKFRIPYNFDRILYDRFAEMFPSGAKQALKSNEVQKFLEGTPQGIIQIGNLLSGPFGLINSHAKRYLPLKNECQWHSKEDGKIIEHTTHFDIPDISITKAYDKIHQIAKEVIGYQAPWKQAFATEICLFSGSDAVEWTSLPMLLADCIPYKERTQLLAYALNSSQKEFIRETLQQYSLKAELKKGNSEEVSSKMNPCEQLQILLSISDHELVSLVDEACNCKVLNIPLSEVRRPKTSPPRLIITTAQHLELKNRGIRLSGVYPSVKLMRLLVESYTESKELEDLKWKICCNSLDSHQSKLADFIYQNGPKVTLEKLVLSKKSIVNYFSKALKILSKDRRDDEDFISQCLFKLNYDEPVFDDSTSILKDRLKEFKSVLLSISDVESEDRKALVRKAGVNLFVSLENFLQRLLTYNTWLLFSDHFLITRFIYSHRKALCMVS